MTGAPGPPVFVLRLYVAGGAPQSAWAIRNARALCEEHLAGRYELEVIDLYQRPAVAREAELFAAPTLVKELPLPLQRFIGTLSDTEGVLVSLGLEPKGEKKAP
jgi:circadian clock protein KaiB